MISTDGVLNLTYTYLPLFTSQLLYQWSGSLLGHLSDSTPPCAHLQLRDGFPCHLGDLFPQSWKIQEAAEFKITRFQNHSESNAKHHWTYVHLWNLMAFWRTDYHGDRQGLSVHFCDFQFLSRGLHIYIRVCVICGRTWDVEGRSVYERC